MARIYPLFSSSMGNSTYIGNANEGILIDCGVSYTRLKNALELCGLSFQSVKGIFITHEHGDHINGLAVTTKKTGLPVYSATGTLDTLFDKGVIRSQAIDIKEKEVLDSMTVSRFETSHDTFESGGYRVDFKDGSSCCVCTDLGYVSDKVRSAVMGVTAILLEANYDEDMLRLGGYPAEVKARIRSDRGHLSNAQCGEFAAQLIASGTTRIILGHISQENNTPEMAEYTVEKIIAGHGFQRGRDYLLCCAPIQTKGGFTAF